MEPVSSANVTSCTRPVDTSRAGATNVTVAVKLISAPSGTLSIEVIVTDIETVVFFRGNSIFFGGWHHSC